MTLGIGTWEVCMLLCISSLFLFIAGECPIQQVDHSLLGNGSFPSSLAVIKKASINIQAQGFMFKLSFHFFFFLDGS